MALVSDVRVPRICLSPTAGKSSGTASDFRFDVVDSIPLIHGRRSNDVSRFALPEVVRSACAAQQPEPALSIDMYCTHGRRVGPPRSGWLPADQHVCALRVQQSCTTRSCVLQACILLQGYQIQLYQPTSQPNSFRHGGRHSVHAETFPQGRHFGSLLDAAAGR